MKQCLHLAILVAVVTAGLVCLSAQAGTSYAARLSTVPIDVSMQAAIAGSGSATATLSGSTLAIAGSYTGLKSPATTVQLHNAQKGIRGRVLSGLDLRASGGTSGTISGTVTLTPELIGEFTKGRIYLQLQSERAPDGNLWGWFLPREGRQP